VKLFLFIAPWVRSLLCNQLSTSVLLVSETLESDNRIDRLHYITANLIGVTALLSQAMANGDWRKPKQAPTLPT